MGKLAKEWKRGERRDNLIFFMTFAIAKYLERRGAFRNCDIFGREGLGA